MKPETALQIVDRELRASEAGRRKQIAKAIADGNRMIKDAHEAHTVLELQLKCNATGKHKFKTVNGSGAFGSRFEEQCMHCGWVHTC